MKTLLAALLFVTSIASASDEQSQRAMAEELLRKAYMSEATERFCMTNPEATYFTTISEITIPVDCKIRNDWVRLIAKKQ